MAEMVGHIIQNRYSVDSFLGRGGMADVYKVWDQVRAVHLAMKVLHSDLAEDRTFLRRFKREADTLARLQHPHIVRSYGLETDGRLAFILMDYIEGFSLRTRIFDLDRPFSLSETLEIMQPVCAALHYAHQSGVVHCDIKPANIMLHKTGNVLVSDFGISRLTEAATATMVGAGTPAYMSPEQARGEELSPQSDIYSLGIMLYEMLAGGERPFSGELARITGSTAEKVRWEQIHAAPPSLKGLNPDISVELEAVVMKCLEKNLENRYASAIEALNALAQLAGETRQVAESPESITGPVGNMPGMVALSKNLNVQTIAPAKTGITVHGQRKFVYLASIPVLLLASSLVIFGLLPVLKPDTILAPSQLPASRTAKPQVVALASPTETPAPSQTPTLVPTPGLGSEKQREKDGMQMVYVPAGAFTMGRDDAGADEKPAHSVTLDAYWIDKTEVTNGRYSLCVKAGTCTPPEKSVSGSRDSYFENTDFDNYPVIYVNWIQADNYCRWAGGRLPTEAEWEKAARGTDSRSFPWGEGLDQNLANYNFNIGDTTEVGSYPNGKSPYGVLDMAGNVWEWVADWYDIYAGGDRSASKDFGTDYRVMRGGAWVTVPDTGALRVSFRGHYGPNGTINRYGFRCALSE